jgi:phosphopentomutase
MSTREEILAQLAALDAAEAAQADAARGPHADTLEAMTDHKLDASKLAVVLADLVDKVYNAADPADVAGLADAIHALDRKVTELARAVAELQAPAVSADKGPGAADDKPKGGK